MRLRLNLRPFAAFLISMVFVAPMIWSSAFYQHHVDTKWILVLFSAALAGFGLSFEKKWHLPPRPIVLLSLALFLAKSAAVIWHWNWVSAINLIETLSLGVLILYFTTVWENHRFSLQTFKWLLLGSSLFVACVALVQFIKSRVLAGNPEPVFFSGTFGNINMMSEYLIFLIPFLIYLVKTEKGWRSWLFQFSAISWIFLILVGRGRSAWIGLAICFLYGLWKGLSRKELLTYAVGFGLFALTWSLPYVGEDYQLAKQGSFSKRQYLYQGSTAMLKEKPLGVGPGNFMYSYLPYQMKTGELPAENEMAIHPHSEWLKWGIENGWAFLLVAFAWWIGMFISVCRISSGKEMETFYRTSFLVLGPQIFFQFPFENPPSFFAIAFLFGLMFAARSWKSVTTGTGLKVLSLVLGILLLVRAGTFSYAKWVEAQELNQADSLERACQFDPSNWRVCFFYSMRAIDSTFPGDGFRNLQKQFENRPFDFHALRGLGYYFIRTRKLAEACEVVQVYNTILPGNRSFSSDTDGYCKSIPNPVPFQSSAQFDQDYRIWIQKFLRSESSR